MGKKTNKKVDLTQDQITAWAENVAGKKPTEIGKERGVTDRTVRNWISKAKEELQPPVDVEEMRGRLFNLSNKAHKAIEDGLDFGEPKDRANVALRLMAGLAVLTDKKLIEHSDQHEEKPTDDLKQEIVDILDQDGKRAANGE